MPDVVPINTVTKVYTRKAISQSFGFPTTVIECFLLISNNPHHAKLSVAILQLPCVDNQACVKACFIFRVNVGFPKNQQERRWTSYSVVALQPTMYPIYSSVFSQNIQILLV